MNRKLFDSSIITNMLTQAIYYYYIHTSQYIVDRIVDKHGNVHLFSVFLEQFID